ncbi:heterokaryon incompatibility protein (HET) domain-containing protein [Cordyceps javanica]|uniref:Heterokaryon incompatibility protein (HET) domain-containing protein n=1 Tax=Cordyceps javanica TaxID=43265 RepID=A0A545UP67_9HYPO|nr:heterokaryon incompatibility protein (HET) domain-containing protein [Cordyceps javanica]TQW02961.1 heterokaryon incompatibility protein (HET) domain-containing protein [Cordyceps javanica]
MSSRVYKPLDSSNGEIRLLHPTSPSGLGVGWELVTCALQSCPPFMAISYLWGQDAKTEAITVNDRQLLITPNLACALNHAAHHFRSAFPGRGEADLYLWADAVCVNQDDTREREEQVKLMGKLYSTAELVMASLGPLDEAIELSMDTLHRVRDQVRDIPADASMDEHIGWLQTHPDLIGADVGLPEDQFDANRRWKLLRQFLYMEYWRRAWVVQELVFARRLLFVSETRSLDPDALFAVLAWVKATKNLARRSSQAPPVRPGWLITSVWNFLTYDNLLGWKSVLRIGAARDGDKSDRLYRVSLACAGNDLRATDPRDLVYGTMALTRMGLEPDYAATSKLSTLYVQFMRWWLDEITLLQVEEDDWTFNHLDLLGEAGTGQVAEDDENRDLARIVPSWVPNFPLSAQVYTPHLLLSPRTADTTIFPSDAPLPRVHEQSLLVPGILLDEVVEVEKVKDIKANQGLLGFAAAYCRRHERYPTGCPPLHGLFRTVMKDVLEDADPEDDDVLVRFFGFVRALLHGPETGTLPAHPEAALRQLGFSTESGPAFAQSIGAAYGVYSSSSSSSSSSGSGARSAEEQQAELGRWLPRLLQPAWHGHWAGAGVLDLCLRTVLEIRELDHASVAETSRGYLAVVPVGARRGDRLCLLHRSDSASVIRGARGGYWEHVGRCYSFGLSECRTEDLERSLVRDEIIELR